MMKWLTVAALAMVPSQVMAFEDWSGFYAEVYGGGIGAGEMEVLTADPLELTAGTAFGASIGVNAPVPGWALELDAMYTSAEIAEAPGYYVETYSTMAKAEYSVPLGDMFEAYGAVGLGAVYMTAVDGALNEVDGLAAGYQLSAGGRAAVAENVAVFGEVKYQDTFSAVRLEDVGASARSPTLGVVGGIRLSMN